MNAKSASIADRLIKISHGGSDWPLWLGADNVPRILDVEWAARLGYDRPRKIRDLIKAMSGTGRLGDVKSVCTRPGQTGGRPATEYYLTEAQALKIAAKSDTEYADVILDSMIAVFMAVRGTPAPAAAALPGKVEPLLFALQFPGLPIGHLHGRSISVPPEQLQLLEDPGAFWGPGCCAFVARPGKVVHKRDGVVYAEGAEILRQATEADLATARVYLSGRHAFTDGSIRSIEGRYREQHHIYAFGTAQVTAHGKSLVVRARDRAQVIAMNCYVAAGDDAFVTAGHWARVSVAGRAVVQASDDCVVDASGEAVVHARHRAVVRTHPDLLAYLTDQATRIDYDPRGKAPPRALMAVPREVGHLQQIGCALSRTLQPAPASASY